MASLILIDMGDSALELSFQWLPAHPWLIITTHCQCVYPLSVCPTKAVFRCGSLCSLQPSGWRRRSICQLETREEGAVVGWMRLKEVGEPGSSWSLSPLTFPLHTSTHWKKPPSRCGPSQLPIREWLYFCIYPCPLKHDWCSCFA